MKTCRANRCMHRSGQRVSPTPILAA